MIQSAPAGFPFVFPAPVTTAVKPEEHLTPVTPTEKPAEFVKPAGIGPEKIRLFVLPRVVPDATL